MLCSSRVHFYRLGRSLGMFVVCIVCRGCPADEESLPYRAKEGCWHKALRRMADVVHPCCVP